MRYNNKSFGHVTLNVIPIPVGGISLRELHIQSPLFDLHTEGEWREDKGKNQTSHFTGILSTEKASELLNDWGYGIDSLAANKGEIHFNLTWPNTPYHPTITNLSGNLSLLLNEGRIIHLSSANTTKMDIGRLINLFSIDAIPHNLAFFSLKRPLHQGYHFDAIRGDFTLEKGNAFTKNTRIESPLALMQITGRIGLATSDVDIHFDITPYLTASIPVVVAIWSPPAAAAAWMVDKIAGHTLSKLVTYHYTVKGPWDNPAWARLPAL
jgi:uncharacterized protein YhdP